MGTVLNRAIERRGSSIRNYVGGSGLAGSFQKEFRVYGRTGQLCPRCGTPQPMVSPATTTESRILPALLLCFFLGVFGAHRFYVGKIGTGILELLTLGGLGIWWLVDMILIVTGSFRDKNGRKITEWV